MRDLKSFKVLFGLCMWQPLFNDEYLLLCQAHYTGVKLTMQFFNSSYFTNLGVRDPEFAGKWFKSYSFYIFSGRYLWRLQKSFICSSRLTRNNSKFSRDRNILNLTLNFIINFFTEENLNLILFFILFFRMIVQEKSKKFYLPLLVNLK